MHSFSTTEFTQYGKGSKVIPVFLVLGYLFIIVYGSLLPFNRNELTFDAAWVNFQHIPLLKLSVVNRADLVANILLYIPLGFLTCGLLAGASRRSWVLFVAMVFSLLFSAAVAVSVEFTQQFFTPRTVSLNDLYAEFAGSALGVLLWPIAGLPAIRLIRTILQGGEQARHAVLVSYTLAYLGLSFFPYDFLLSFDEWERKLTSDHVGWLFAPLCGSGCTWKLIPEALAIAPFSLVLFRSLQRVPIILAAVTGLMLGVLIEGLQLAIASGVSQGASVIARSAGMVLGAGMMHYAAYIDWRRIRQYIRPVLIVASIPYLFGLALVSHWFSGNWLEWSEGMTRLETVHFVPFYYHYYTTERAALVSLLFQTGIYAPVGIGFWLWRWANRSGHSLVPFSILPGITAGLLACVMETGKLFVTRTHPDPTDILIAMVSAALAYRLLSLLFAVKDKQTEKNLTNSRWARPASLSNEHNHSRMNSDRAISSFERRGAHSAEGDGGDNALQTESLIPRSSDDPVKVPVSPAPRMTVKRPLWSIIAGSLALCSVMAIAITHPLGAAWVLPPVIIYAGLLWWRPSLWLVWILAFLPLLDLSPWSGRLYWTEYDTLLLVTIGVGYLRLCSVATTMQPIFRLPAKMMLALFTLSAAVSLGIGILPLSELDHNAFASYHSSYNGLRVVKGLLFALALIPLLAHEWSEPARATRKVVWGMSLGLAAEVIYVLWERLTFSGLFNFDTAYRITGSFHGMHVGGAYIETYLVAVLPFVVLWAWQQRNVWAAVAAAGLYGLAVYSVMVTFSRGGQFALALVTLIVVIGFMRFSLQGKVRRLASLSVVLLIAAVSLVAAWPVISGKFSQSRWEAIEKDIVKRTDHWADVLNIFQLRDGFLFGVGLGSFPSAYYWGTTSSSRPATYNFIEENNNTFLRLGSGNLAYFEQSVDVQPEQKYTLAASIRSTAHNAALIMSVCEKSIIYSYTCLFTPLRINQVTGQWVHYEAQIFTKNFGPPGTRFQRPIKLSLFNNRTGTLVDVDNVALYDAKGNDLVHNGDFSNGMRHWFFSTDHYWPWHVENLYLNILFEQGWFGLVCFLMLLVYVIARSLPPALSNDPFKLVLCASFAAFLVIGMLNSWNDEPRLAFLFYFLLITGLIADARPASTPQPVITSSSNSS